MFTLAFWIGRALESSLTSTVDVMISAKQFSSDEDAIMQRWITMTKYIYYKSLLFATVRPLFFRISATVTTVAMAEMIRKFVIIPTCCN
jgi:hypothetical protein